MTLQRWSSNDSQSSQTAVQLRGLMVRLQGPSALLQVSQLCILWILLFKMPHSHHLLGNYFQLQAKDVYPQIANLPTINQSFASRQPWCFLRFISNFRRRSAVVSNSFRSLCVFKPLRTVCHTPLTVWRKDRTDWAASWSGRRSEGAVLQLQRTGFSLRWRLLWWSMGSRLSGFSSRSSRALVQ